MLRHRRVLLLLLQPVTSQSKTKSVRAPLLLLLLLFEIISYSYNARSSLKRIKKLTEKTTKRERHIERRRRRNEPFFSFYIYLFTGCVCVLCAFDGYEHVAHRLLLLFFLCPCFLFPFLPFILEVRKKYAQQDEHIRRMMTSQVAQFSSIQYCISQLIQNGEESGPTYALAL